MILLNEVRTYSSVDVCCYQILNLQSNRCMTQCDANCCSTTAELEYLCIQVVCTVCQSPSAVGGGFIFSPLCPVATFNSSCLLAVCPVPWPAFEPTDWAFLSRWGSLTVHTSWQTSFTVASKPHPLWQAVQDSPWSHWKSTLWADGMRMTWKGPLYPEVSYFYDLQCVVCILRSIMRWGKDIRYLKAACD